MDEVKGIIEEQIKDLEAFNEESYKTKVKNSKLK